MELNNYFSFATDESSQDAFIAWCANWANSDGELAEFGRTFVSDLTGVGDISSVDIYQQFMRIDVLLIVNKTVAVIIEDKVYSSEHDDQIRRYMNDLARLRNKDGKTMISGKEYELSAIRAVYLKTGNFYPIDNETKNKEFVRTVDRSMLMDWIKPFTDRSEIIRGFCERLQYIDSWYRKYENYYLNHEYGKAFSEVYGMYYCVSRLFGEQEKFHVKGETSAAGKVSPDCGSGKSGEPYAWAWLWGCDEWFWLGWKLCSVKGKYAFSLRMYINCEAERRSKAEAILTFLREIADREGCGWIAAVGRINKYENEIAHIFFDKDISDKLNSLYPKAKTLFDLADEKFDLSRME